MIQEVSAVIDELVAPSIDPFTIGNWRRIKLQPFEKIGVTT